MKIKERWLKVKNTEVIYAYGHKNISAKHGTTLEFTKDQNLSERGDCIIAVLANKAMIDLSNEFKQNLRKENIRITVLVEAGGFSEAINAYGSPQLTLTHPTDIVIRKGNYICNRTLAIYADKAACSLSRKLVEKIRNPTQEVKITLTVKS